MSGPTLLELVVEHVRDVRWEALPEATRAAAKRVVADSVACAVAASGADVIDQLEGALPALPAGSGPEPQNAQVIGRQRAPLGQALLLNCALVRQLDLMDVYWDKDVCHPSENVAVALTVAEAEGRTGKELLEAVVAAYDVQVGLCRIMSFSDAGLHHVSAAGFAVPMVLGRLRGLDGDATVRSATITASRHLTMGALSRGGLSNAKSLAYGLTAVEALLAHDLAVAGLTGPARVMEWLLQEICGLAVTGEQLTDAMQHTVDAVALKRYPVQFALQGVVEAAATASSGGLSMEEVDRITVRVPSWTIERTADAAKYRPQNRETADHSLPVCAAMAALDADLTVGSMLAGRWADDDVAGLVARLDVERDEDLERANPGGGPAHVVIACRDGSRLEHRLTHPLGDPGRPMSEQDVHAKFRSLTTARLGEQRAQELWMAIMGLDTQADLAQVMALSAGGGR